MTRESDTVPLRKPLVILVGLVGLAGALAACPDKSAAPVEVAPTDDDKAGAATADAPPVTGEATLLLMADIRGVLRPCGCTLELQKGGFDRLGPHVAKERKVHPDLALLHAGPMFFEEAEVEDKKQAQRKRQSSVAAELVAKVGFDVAGATAVDIAAAEGRYGDLVDRAKLDITAANLKREGVPKVRVKKVGDLRVGIFALAAPHEPLTTDPKAAAKAALSELRGKADVVVLLSALGLRETKRLVRAVDGIHFAVAGGLGEHPVVSDEAELVGKTRVMQFHREGRFVGRLTVHVDHGSADFVDASAPSKTEMEALDARIGQLEKALKRWEAKRADDDPAVKSARHQLASLKTDRDRLAKPRPGPPKGKSWFSFVATALPWDLPQDPDILALMDAFDEELKKINLAHVGTLPEPKPGEAVYVGASACMDCHDEVEPFWTHDRHPTAWKTLEDQKKTFDAECVSCHVTGYGKAGGSILGKLKNLEAVQCEACHGPGSLHVDADDEVEAKKTIVRGPTADVCTTCHNKHHSPNFDFRAYKKKLMVPGHGLPVATE